MRHFPFIFSTIIIVACNSNKKEEVKKEEVVKTTETTVQLTDAQMKNAAIATGKPELKNISAVLKVNGRIDVPPQNIVSVSAPLGGYLRSTKLLPGMYVSRGQNIATLEDQLYIQLQQDYLTAKSKLVYAEQEYNRQKQLNQSKAGSDKVYQQSQQEYSSERILVSSLSQKLRLLNINPARLNETNISRSIYIPSPISGYVSKVNVNIGKYVNPSDILFEIVNPADIHLALDVFEKDVNKLYIGQKLVAYTNTNPEKKYPCEIKLINKDISDNRSFEVHCHFLESDKSLLPGMFMNAEIQVQSKDAYVLPSDAILNYENKQYVFIAKGKNQFEIAEVSAGTSENGVTAINIDSNQVLNNQSIVIKGAYSLLMKMKNTSDEE